MSMQRRAFIGGAILAGALARPWLVRAQVFTARQYHVQPEGSHLDVFLNKIWAAVREQTNGRLQVRVYPRNNDVTAGEPELLEQLQGGDLEFFTLNGNILSQAHPAADIQGIPFAYSSSEQVAALNDGPFGEYLRAELSGKGVQLIPFGGMENGFKQITSVDKPIRTASDLEHFRMRVPNGRLFVAFYRALGAEPRIVNFNRLREALATHDVDGQENPLVIADENRLYEVCRYLGLTSHQWAGYNMLSSQMFWRRLPEDMQDVVVRNTKRIVAQQRDFIRRFNVDMRERLEQRGMVINEVDVPSFRGRLVDTGFYREWRVLCGAKAWALMEAQTGPVG